MGFCPVCGAHHDPNVPCADRAGELLGDIGLKKIPKKRRNEFKHLQEVVDRSMIKLVLIVLTFVILFILFGVMAERSKWWLLGWAILTIILISLIIYPMHKFRKR